MANRIAVQLLEYRVVRETYMGPDRKWVSTVLPYGPYENFEAAEKVAKRYCRPRRPVPRVGDKARTWVQSTKKINWTMVGEPYPH